MRIRGLRFRISNCNVHLGDSVVAVFPSITSLIDSNFIEHVVNCVKAKSRVALGARRNVQVLLQN